MNFRSKIALGAFLISNACGYPMPDYLYPDTGAAVIPGLYIGSMSTAMNKEFLDAEGIDIVINLSNRRYHELRPTLHFDILDECLSGDRITRFSSLMDKISRTICKNNHLNILVHCAAGINRSAAAIGIYLASRGCDYVDIMEALTLANNKRGSVVLTNESFREYIRARVHAEKICFGDDPY